MKKFLSIFIALILLCGCSTDIDNTPKKQVEKFLSKYQSLDEEVINDLNKVIEEEEKFNTVNRDKYKDVIKNQYKDLTYTIKNEVINGDESTVEVEITVKDYKKVMDEAEVYRNNNTDKFSDEFGVYDEPKYIDYVIEKLKESKDTIKYTIYLKVKMINEKWEVQQIDSITEDKILGIYSY